MNNHPTSGDNLDSVHLQDQLDLLIDDELSIEQQAHLFQQLDATPEGWRLCAQTFLEERLIKQSGQDTSQPTVTPKVAPKAVPIRSWKKDIGLAACAAIALTLTFFAGKTTATSPNAQPVAKVTNEPTIIAPLVTNPIDYEGISDQGEWIYSTRYELPPPLIDLMVQTGNRVEKRQRTIQLPSNGNHEMELPLVETRIFLKYPH